MRMLGERILRWLQPPALFDGVALLGLLLLGGGLWWISPAAALIVLGSLLLSFGIVGAMNWSDRRNKKTSPRRPDAN